MIALAPNQLRTRREALGLTQVALAAAVDLSRQSVGAIEAGRAVPSVDVALRLARALGCTVEALFAAPEPEARLATEPWGAGAEGRVALAHLAGRWVSYPLTGGGLRTGADGLAVRTRAGVLEVEPVRPPAEARDNVVVMGCAAALGLLADRLNAGPGPGRFLWLPGSSTRALQSLARQQAHVAGLHLVDDCTGEANVADVQRHAWTEPVVLITLARWEAGLVTAPGNPKGLRGAADLGRSGLRLVTREVGSGARQLLDRALRQAGVANCAGTLEASGHLEVAQAVALGAADVGVATRDAAIAYGLGFLPLAEERYDLAIPLSGLEDPRLERLLDGMTTSAYRRELSALGYDVRACGDRVAEVRAP